ncbi:MAG: hypothetical protein IPH32_04910 [Bacteroidetes bacterium]|nr:hypothetical protein [Bacteroidota bacterium]
MKVPLLPQSSYVLFAQNKGQWHDNVLFEGKFKGGKVFLEQQGLSYVFFPKDGLEECITMDPKLQLPIMLLKWIL